KPPRVLLLEEIENGIHPAKLRVLMELIRSQSERAGIQVFATTHSPILLAWLDEEMYSSTFLCNRSELTGETRLVPLSEIPHFVELARERRAVIADLFSQGWFELAL
ncbi:MAG: ATP-binding protein, partial [Verrucomicrobiales bacterium]|nr:ATP-binding protein [Verrucomicrobiales bacterium]